MTEETEVRMHRKHTRAGISRRSIGGCAGSEKNGSVLLVKISQALRILGHSPGFTPHHCRNHPDPGSWLSVSATVVEPPNAPRATFPVQPVPPKQS